MILEKNKIYQKLPELAERWTGALCLYPKGDPEKDPTSVAFNVPLVDVKEFSGKKDLCGLPGNVCYRLLWKELLVSLMAKT